jgi:hypothetical protein
MVSVTRHVSVLPLGLHLFSQHLSSQALCRERTKLVSVLGHGQDDVVKFNTMMSC